MSEFKVPAKPWGPAEVKLLMDNARLLDNETRAELGLGPSDEEVAPQSVGTGVDGYKAEKPDPDFVPESKEEEVVEEVEEVKEEVEEEKNDE